MEPVEPAAARGGPVPRPAATLVILRDGDAGPEVVITERVGSLRFMGGATVFPGGAVAPADRDPRWERASALHAASAMATADGEPTGALAHLVCALRESFEEVGFLLGAGPLDRLGRESAADPARFLQECLRHGIVLSTDRLVPGGRWVTPLGAPMRFDAHFFLVSAPPGWEPIGDPAEVASCRWASPREALDELGAGRLLMAPPTIAMLHRLADCASVEAALSAVVPSDDAPPARSVRLSPLVSVVLAPNPGLMTGPGTNTYVVGSAGSALVIDPAVPDEGYLAAVMAAAGNVSSVLVTHRHPDHVGGAAALVARTQAVVRAWGDAPAGGVAVIPAGDGEVVTAGGVRVRALHCPGHAPDHLCFALQGAAGLFSGDCILGEGTAVIAPPEGDMAAYLRTLARLKDMNFDRIYPGHFRALDGGRATIEGYIEHRNAREQAILAALGGEPAPVADIVAVVYADTPMELHGVAALSALAHLHKLEAEGRAARADDRWLAVGDDDD